MDRHEYEINQLINPKKDIVKSNSKHRDKIETLILGRNGIGGGGDTPKQETLWAIEFESGKFAFGHANENQIFVATSGIGRQIWYADGGGVVEGYTESVDEITDTLIDTFNEHFGTNISHLTPDTELFNVGDTVHNWNAYEKITLDLLKVKFNGGYFGQKIGDTLYIATSNGSNQIIVDMQSGLVGTLNGPELTDQRKTYYLNYMRVTGHEVSEVISETTTLTIGDEIEEWNEYILIDG